MTQDNFSNTLNINKSVVSTSKGVCASQHKIVSEIGAGVLSAGGNAVDATIAMSFAIGVLEPWMSGMGGGGFMNIKWANAPAKIVQYSMKSPKNINFADYKPTGEVLCDDVFAWEKMDNLHNEMGGGSVAVPGMVAGMEKAHQHYGTIPWEDLLHPAIDLAKRGIELDWYAQLMISGVTAKLNRFANTKKLFLTPEGYPKASSWMAHTPPLCPMPKMAETLEDIAKNGAVAFYKGDIAQSIVHATQKYGGYLSLEDLRSYKSYLVEALSFSYNGTTVHVPPKYAAGQTIKMAFDMLADFKLQTGFITDNTYCAYTDAIYTAYAHRLKYESPQDNGCTTHFNVADKHGNVVANTQTLLSAFGSGITTDSGFMLNNGLMWFDPIQGRPNSLTENTYCLANMCPTILENDRGVYGLGACGGRKIFPAVLQLASFIIDYNMDIEQAFHTPRINCVGTKNVLVDMVLSQTQDTVQALKHRGYDAYYKRKVPYPFDYACPSAVYAGKTENQGITEICCAWGDAVAEV